MFRKSASRLHFRRLEGLFHAGIAGDLTDGELLDQFLGCSEAVSEAAFTALVERHGPMVYRVCRQALGDHHAAQDALQATFLVLARQAGLIQKRMSVSSWLFGVAQRVAARIRMQEARRRRCELRWTERSSVAISAAQGAADLDPYPELHAEINRLPEKYRIPIVLCYFEGLTHEQAASRLRWPLGTVKIRLSRARERLRVRLERRGHSSVLLSLACWKCPGPVTGLPDHLVDAITEAGCRYAARTAGGGLTASTVVKLSEGVIKSMLMHKLKTVAVVLAGLSLLGSGAMVAAQQRTRRHSEAEHQPAAVDSKDDSGTLQLSGRTAYVPDRLIKIRPRFDTLVEQVLVEVGQTVKKGDPLVELFSTDLAAAKNDFQTAYVQWQHDLTLRELREEQFLKEIISKQLLFDTRNSENKSRLAFLTVRQKLALFEVPEGDIDALVKNLNPANLPDRDAMRDLLDKGKMTRRSPVEGTVVARDVVPGNLYDTHDTLLVIGQDDVMQVWANIYERDPPAVQIGQDLTVSFPYANRRVKGKVEFIDSRVNPETRAARIRISIPNPDHWMKAEMLVRVELETGPRAAGIEKQRRTREEPLDTTTTRDRLDKLELKLDRLFGKADERTSRASILDRLDALERKVDRLLDGRR